MAKVAVIMGSSSDWDTMRHATEVLERFGVEHHREVVSAHRTPERMFEFASGAAEAGFACIIAGAGGAAHLPGMVASLTSLPVLGVPVQSRMLSGVDSLLSIVQMPAGVPTATFSIGSSGATNAALFAVRLLAVDDAKLRDKLAAFRAENAERALSSTSELVLPAPPKRPARAQVGAPSKGRRRG